MRFSLQQSETLDGLQIARAFAALGIAYFHSWHVTMPFPTGTSHPIPILSSYGWVSVDFFFAISGFVICMIASKPRFRPLEFTVRRIFRLYPLWIVTSGIFLYLSLKYLGLPERATPAFIAYSLTLLPTESFPFYDLGWCLQHEAAFYVTTALLVPRLGLAALATFLCAGITADHIWTLPWYLHEYASYYPNFLAGIAAFVAHRYLKQLGAWMPIAAGFIMLAIFISFVGRGAFPLALFVLLVGFVNIRADEMSLLQRAGVLLGDASYSIYLIHPLVFYYVYAHLQPPLPPIWSQEVLRFGSIAIVSIIAVASWKLFETPAIRAGNWLISRSLRPHWALDNPHDVVRNDRRLASSEG
jgi:peptidoglycan/LPS O-acetylase OafA/YrhL